MASAMMQMDEDILLAKHGYIRSDKILKKTVQGDLFTAKNENDELVAIKKVSKKLHLNNECIDIDDPKWVHIVDKDIVKEAKILKYLTKENKAINDSIVQYIDFFETENDYYLVMEYIESNVDLKQFVLRAHELINEDKLKLTNYQKIIKNILWQLITLLNWLHSDMNCSHLDISPENIMLENPFLTKHKINSDIRIKVVDFGVAESEMSDNKCRKQHISINNEQYIAPNIHSEGIYDGVYDGKAADMWSFGMITYYCFMGQFPYQIMQQYEDLSYDTIVEFTGYTAIYKNQIRQWLFMNNLLKFINPKILNLLNGLLKFDETKRLNSKNVFKHPYFKSYYKKYILSSH